MTSLEDLIIERDTGDFLGEVASIYETLGVSYVGEAGGVLNAEAELNLQVAAILRVIAHPTALDDCTRTLVDLWHRYRQDHKHSCPDEGCNVCDEHKRNIRLGKLALCELLGLQPAEKESRLFSGIKRPSKD